MNLRTGRAHMYMTLAGVRHTIRTASSGTREESRSPLVRDAGQNIRNEDFSKYLRCPVRESLCLDRAQGEGLACKRMTTGVKRSMDKGCTRQIDKRFEYGAHLAAEPITEAPTIDPSKRHIAGRSVRKKVR